jgi:cobyrinic acid a,c-diamide synthase
MLRAHEFHYSSLENVADGAAYALTVKRGHGIDGRRDGLIHRNLVASYVHRRSVGADDWAARFVAFVRQVKRSARHEEATRIPRAVAH